MKLRLPAPATFAGRRFMLNFAVCGFNVVVEYVMLLSAGIIAGRVSGEDAVAGVNLGLPIFSIISFVSTVIASGMGVLVTTASARGDEKEADRILGLGGVLALVVGLGLSLILFLSQPFFFRFFAATPTVLAHAEGYYRGLILLSPAMMAFLFFLTLVLNEGNAVLCAIAVVLRLVASIGLSWLFCRSLGTLGVGLGMVVATALGFAVFLLHFLSKRSRLRFHRGWHWNASIDIFRYGFTDAAQFLYPAAAVFVLNAFCLHQFGNQGLVVWALVVNVLELILQAGDGFGEALRPLICAYSGEDNLHGLERTMQVGRNTVLALGLASTTAILLFADSIPAAFGITDPSTVTAAAHGLRIASLGVVFSMFDLLLVNYYIFIGRLRLALGFVTAVLLVCLLGCSIGGGVLFGINGLWVGFALFGLLPLAGCMAVNRLANPKLTCMLQLDPVEMARQLAYDAPASIAGITGLRDRLGKDLAARGIGSKARLKAELLVEETELRLLKDRNGRGGVIECTVWLDPFKNIRLQLRESADVSTAADPEGRLTGLQDYFSSCIIAGAGGRRYAVVVGFNRTVYEIKCAEVNG